MRWRIFELVCLGWLSLLGASGCGSAAMAEHLVPLPGLPRPGLAMVVFVQPSTYAESYYFPVFDERGMFLGDSEPATWFSVELSPGAHEFYARGENLAAVRAELSPGRTYYVEVASRLGFFSPRVQLLPIARRFDTFGNLEEWIAESRAQVRIAATRLDQDDVARVVYGGHARLADYGPDELERRTLQPQDGM